MVGLKYDSEKPKMYLLPPKAILEVSKVLTFGASKYGEKNWALVENHQDRYSGAALRHLFSHLDGEELDEETNLNHLAHAICCLLFKLESHLSEKSSKEEGLGTAFGHEHQESNRTTSFGHSYYEEGSLRDIEYSLQHYPPHKDN